MSRANNMLRARRRDTNVKPNRRLDRKSSRGMIYENEELRLKTININAEVERGQSDIKKLKRENDMLKKEMWYLRDEYDKLERMLKDKRIDFSSSSTSCSETCSSCSEEDDEEDNESSDIQVETSQNLENVQKTNLENIQRNFDHLSVVVEENSAENSDKNSEGEAIKPDQSYPITPPFPSSLPQNNTIIFPEEFYEKACCHNDSTFFEFQKTSTDLLVKLDNFDFNSGEIARFSDGGNLEELLKDIEQISQQGGAEGATTQPETSAQVHEEKPFKSELNVVLMPNPMPLIGFDKYHNIQRSFDSLTSKPEDHLSASQQNLGLLPPEHSEEQTNFFFGNLRENYVPTDYFNVRYNPDNFVNTSGDESKRKETGSKQNLLAEPNTTTSDHISSENEENLKFNPATPAPPSVEDAKKSPKLSIRRKVSIHFKGKKDKTKKMSLDSNGDLFNKSPKIVPEKKHSLFDIKFGSSSSTNLKPLIHHQKTPSLESRKSTTETSVLEANKTPSSSDNNGNKKKENQEKKARNSTSASPDRKHVQMKEEGVTKHKKHKKTRGRRATVPATMDRERSHSVYSDRSNRLDVRLGSMFGFDDYYSERERTNSLSSRDTTENIAGNNRKMSLATVQHGDKVPWCGCWGNGCL